LSYIIPAGKDLVEIYISNENEFMSGYLKIMNSFHLLEVATSLKSQKQLNLESPKINLKVDNDWDILEYQDGERLAILHNNKYPAGYVTMYFTKAVSQASVNNQDELDAIKRSVVADNQKDILGSEIDTEFIAGNPQAILNAKIKNTIKAEKVIKQIKTNTVLDQVLEYRIKYGDKYIVIRVDYFGVDKGGYENYKKEVEKMLAQLGIAR
jgi:hypothetical protein